MLRGPDEVLPKMHHNINTVDKYKVSQELVNWLIIWLINSYVG